MRRPGHGGRRAGGLLLGMRLRDRYALSKADRIVWDRRLAALRSARGSQAVLRERREAAKAGAR